MSDRLDQLLLTLAKIVETGKYPSVANHLHAVDMAKRALREVEVGDTRGDDERS